VIRILTGATAVLLVTTICAQDQKPAAPPAAKAEKADHPKTLQLGDTIDASLSLPDIDGNVHSAAEMKGRITVVNFWSTQCPIQEAWDPTLGKIQLEYEAKGVHFVMINSNEANGEIADGKPAEGKKPYQGIRDTLKERDLPYTVLVDHGNVVADRFGALTTPDIFVFDQKGVLVYRGAIDDDQRGTKGDKAKHYLREALDALLAGKAVPTAQTKPVGCTIKRAKKARAADQSGKNEE
jgi:thiol-disulfide isomerase/thioredoxin